MGVFGLMYYWENECNGGLDYVKLSEIATKYRNQMKKDPVIVVDMPCCIPFFVKKSEEQKKLAENLLMFINNCFDLGIKLKFIGEGLKPDYKQKTVWKKKQLYFLKSTPKWFEDYKNFYFGIWLNVATYVFHLTDKCEYVRSLKEADDFIIHYAKTEGCFAILSNDTDLHIADGAQYHLSIKHLDVCSMTTCNYNRDNLAKSLNIGISQLPIFCSLLDSYVGFDYTKNAARLKRGISLRTEYQRVTDLIRGLPVNDFEFDSFVLKKEERQKFEARLQFYMGQKKVVQPMKGNDNWSEIIGLAEKRHVAGIVQTMLLEILINRAVYLYTQKRTGEWPVCWLIQLRKKIYGILFFECPDNTIFIREHCFEKFRPKFTDVFFHRRFHCGLLNLWSEDTSPEMLYKRRRVFCQALNEKLTPEYLLALNIPEEILFTVLTLYCLISDRKCSYQDAKILLLQAILVNKLTAKEIEGYRNSPDASSFDLCQWFTETLRHIQLLNSACGEPYCFLKGNFIYNFDGTLYEYFYGKMKNSWRSEENIPLSQEVVDSLGELEKKLKCLVRIGNGPEVR